MMESFWILFASLFYKALAAVPIDVKEDERAKSTHKIDSINILAYILLISLTVCTIWLFKLRRFRYIHETGLAVIYGLIMGAIIRYTSTVSEVTHLKVAPVELASDNISLAVPPDALYLQVQTRSHIFANREQRQNKSFSYTFHGEVSNLDGKVLNEKYQLARSGATFDPEIFFNIILPPVIFTAGYSLKKKFFFRNLGTIMCYAFIGTTISCFAVAGVIYSSLLLIPHLRKILKFTDCLFFGAIISATDPVTVLAIFNDLHVDVNLYALVFGESVLNDAVAIVLAETINTYVEKAMGTGTSAVSTVVLNGFANFFYIFICSFLLGSFMGCLTAALTKYTKLSNFPLLETALFVLMSYSTFLMAEASDLTGIVAVLFCGICQAHYTFNNLSEESRLRTKQIFELLNFLAENFIFTYIGVSMFTYSKHQWDPGFISVSFLAIAVGRALHVYPLTFLLNLGRKTKIPYNFQHVIFLSGLRGAIAFALAIRTTVTEPRQLILTTTSVIVIVTVILCGGLTTQVLAWLGIPLGSEVDTMASSPRRLTEVSSEAPAAVPSTQQLQGKNAYEKAWLVRKWYNFDALYMKPFLTHSRPNLLETLPAFCHPLARILTTTQQLTETDPRRGSIEDSDSDECLEDGLSSQTTLPPGKTCQMQVELSPGGHRYI